MPSIKVHKPGLCTTVQDIGRIGYQQFGIPVSGVMDEFAFTVANYLVESDKNNAVLEIPFLGPTLEFDFDVTIAITGADIQPKINNQDIKMWQSINVKKGDTLSFGSLKNGIRAYLAFSAEIDVPVVMLGQEGEYTYSVEYNDFNAARDLTNYILASGHKKIAYLGVSEDDVAVGYYRKLGVLRALEKYNLEPENILITNFGMEEGYEIVRENIEKLKKD